MDIDFTEMVMGLAKPGKDITANMTPEEAHLLHMAVGIAGEAGELLDAIKKHVIYKKELDVENVLEECGDLKFYMKGLMEPLGLSDEDAIQHNIKKLGKRYEGHKYSDQAAQDRADKVEPQGMVIDSTDECEACQ